MKLSELDIDFSTLRGALAFLIVSLLISGVMIKVSSGYRDAMLAKLKTNESRFRDMSQKYLGVEEEERIIREDYPLVKAYKEQGVLGGERRLEWIETLQRSASVLKGSRINYQIGARTAFTPNYPINSGSYSLFSSPMKLSLELLHEGDVPSVLSALHQGLGLYDIPKCSFERLGKTVELNASKTNLKADCDLRWITLNLPAEQEAKL